MCARGEHVAVAVSGGADSVCLLHVLVELAAAYGLILSVAHLNHKLRGEASDGDAAFVRDLAASLELPFFCGEAHVAECDGNLEQAGREARRAFFAGLAVDRVATGHTRSDQAETVLYRLLRGSGTAGLSGILPVTGRQIRPLFDCTRTDVLEYLNSRGLHWREDATNAEPSFARNRIRHQVLPALRLSNPALDEILARTACLARDEEDYWLEESGKFGADLSRKRSQGLVFRAAGLAALHPALQRRVLRWAIRQVKGNLRGIDLSDVERILVLASQEPGHGRTQAIGIDVFRSFEWLLIDRPRVGTRSDRDYSVPLFAPGFTPVPGQSSILHVEVTENAKTTGILEGYNTGGGSLDADRLSGPLELRNWRPGDQFRRHGHSIEKIKTLFQLARIPIWDRQGWPVITSGDRIVWTRGFGVSSEFVPERDSRRILHIEEENDSAESNASGSASLY